MPKAVIYCRVSTKEQVENESLGTQLAACLAYCQHRGVDVVKVFEERGESAKSVDRTELQSLLTYCAKNSRKVDYLVVYKVDRFARRAEDHFVLRSMLTKLGICLRSATEPLGEEPSDRMMEGILAVVAQFDNDVRAQRTVTGMRAAADFCAAHCRVSRLLMDSC